MTITEATNSSNNSKEAWFTGDIREPVILAYLELGKSQLPIKLQILIYFFLLRCTHVFLRMNLLYSFQMSDHLFPQALESTAKSRSGVLGAIVIIIGLIQICLVLAACNVMKNTKHPGSKPPFF